MKRLTLFATLAFVLVFFGACNLMKDDLEADKAALRTLIDNDSVWFNGSTTVDSTSQGGFFCGDTVIIWWRGKQTHNDPSLTLNVTGDSAWAEWSRDNYGDIYSLVKPPDTTWLLWTKRVDETARLRAVFRRETAESQEANRGWYLSNISLASGASNGLGSMHIDSMRIASASNPNLLITDALGTYFDVQNLVSFTPGEAITLTLYTNTTSARAFLHTFVLHWPFYVRLEFTDMGDGVFQGSWPAQAIPFPRFAIFDLLARNTIHNPTAAYDFNGWLLPYQIVAPN